MQLALIIAFCLLGSLGAIVATGWTLFLDSHVRTRMSSLAIPYATGTLLGAAFLGMLPQAMRQLPPGAVLTAALAGILVFFSLESLAVWRHCHEPHCEVHSHAGAMILIGDSLHNFVDGVAIAAAFSNSTGLGIATAVAVTAHEIPQEVGDFAILLESGYSPRRAFALNGLVSLTALPGGVLAYFTLGALHIAVPYLLSLAAAGFLYIALADLIPSRRESAATRNVLVELTLILLGVATIAAIHLQHGA